MKKLHIIIYMLLAAVTTQAQTVGEAFYIYRNDGQFNAFFRDEVKSIEYSYEDANGNKYDEIVTQLVYTTDSVYSIPLAAIDSVAFAVNQLRLSDDYVPVSEDSYVVEEADTLNGNYLLRFLGAKPQLSEGDVMVIANDTLAMQVRINGLSHPDGSRVRIASERASLADIFVGGTFTLSTEQQPPAAARRANVYYPVEIVYYDEQNRIRRVRRREDTDFTHRFYENSIDFSGEDLYKTKNSRLYLESCHFGLNLDLAVTCNFSSKDEGIEKYRHGEMALQKSVIRGSIESDVMLRFDASGNDSFDCDGKPIMLKRNVHKPVTAKFIVDGVPILVVMTTHLMTDASYKTEGSFSVYTGFATNSTAEHGFSWSQADGLRPYADYSSSYTYHKPTFEGQVHLEEKVSVFPRITFSLYGLVGPSFDIKPYLKPVFDFGFHDQVDSNKNDFYGAECNIFAGIDAAVGLTFLAVLGNEPAKQSKPRNVVEKNLLESPKEIKFESGDPKTLTPGKTMKATFHVTEQDYLLNRTLNAELPFAVKFETNSGTLASDFAFVEPFTGLVTMEWTPASETTDGKDAYIEAIMHDANGNVKTSAKWTPEKAVNYCPDDNHPHMIDLGLPSGTKWACCNVGASTPEEYGNYYAWGETSTKNIFNKATYEYSNGDGYYDYEFIGSDIAGTEYDAATANWGSPWHMPTDGLCDELLSRCSSMYTTQNGVRGRKFTGPNGGTIFLPTKDGDTDVGLYWSSTAGTFVSNAYHLYFGATGYSVYGAFRFRGLFVRPVR